MTYFSVTGCILKLNTVLKPKEAYKDFSLNVIMIRMDEHEDAQNMRLKSIHASATLSQ